MDSPHAQKDFGWQRGLPEGAKTVNGRVWFQDLHGLRSVFVEHRPFYHFAVQNPVENRFAAVQLVDAELAGVDEVCQAFSLSSRTFSRVRRQLHQGGIEGLVQQKRGPKTRRPETQQLAATIVRLYEQQQTVYQIASRVGMCPRTVGRVLKDQGIARRGDRRASPTLPFADTPSATEVSGARDRSPTDADGVRMQTVGDEAVAHEAVRGCAEEPPVDVSRLIPREPADPQPALAESSPGNQTAGEEECMPMSEEALATPADPHQERDAWRDGLLGASAEWPAAVGDP